MNGTANDGSLSVEIPEAVFGVSSDVKISDEEAWRIFWEIVESAWKLAKVKWKLHQNGLLNDADVPEHSPKPGFHLRITRLQSGEEGEEVSEDENFPSTEDGLRDALKAAEKAQEQGDVNEILLEISGREHLPPALEEYCAPIVQMWRAGELGGSHWLV